MYSDAGARVGSLESHNEERIQVEGEKSRKKAQILKGVGILPEGKIQEWEMLNRERCDRF